MDAVLVPTKATEEAMDMDEEGRPRFAPAKDIVCAPGPELSIYKG